MVCILIVMEIFCFLGLQRISLNGALSWPRWNMSFSWSGLSVRIMIAAFWSHKRFSWLPSFVTIPIIQPFLLLSKLIINFLIMVTVGRGPGFDLLKIALKGVVVIFANPFHMSPWCCLLSPSHQFESLAFSISLKSNSFIFALTGPRLEVSPLQQDNNSSNCKVPPFFVVFSKNRVSYPHNLTTDFQLLYKLTLCCLSPNKVLFGISQAMSCLNCYVRLTVVHLW